MSNKMKFLANLLGIICGTLAAIFIAVPSMYIFYNIHILERPLSEQPVIVTNQQIDRKQLSGYTSIALFGLDSRKESYDKGNRSDTIIIVSINNDTKRIKLASIYRDTYLDIPGHGLDKITHAYFWGGPELAINTLNRNLDLNIQDFVSINWFSAAKAVDILGGVEVKVKPNELNELNRIIKMTNASFSQKASFVTSSGKQILNGIQAVSYARIRKIGYDDFERTKRQRNILHASFLKAKTASFSQVIRLINTLAPEIATSLSATQIIDLAKPVMNYSLSGTAGFPQSQSGQKLNGVSYVISSNLCKELAQLHHFLFDTTQYQPSSTVLKIQSLIQINIKTEAIP